MGSGRGGQVGGQLGAQLGAQSAACGQRPLLLPPSPSDPMPASPPSPLQEGETQHPATIEWLVSTYQWVKFHTHSIKTVTKRQVNLPVQADPLLVNSICRLADHWPREVVVTQKRPPRGHNRQ